MKRTCKRFAGLLTALLLMGSILPVNAAAANTTKGTTLRLEKTEGTVSVSNARGSDLTLKTGAKLYSGYTISTAAASYAWVSLDDDIVVKADENSKIQVKQSGKKLEVLVKSGKLFFNVEKPLEDDASLNIRTSTMTTGIRGTSGLVSVRKTTTADSDGSTRQSDSSHLVVYEGTVTLSYTQTTADPAAPQAVVANVTAGWQADVVQSTLTAPDVGVPAVSTQAEVTPVSVRDALSSTGFVAVEIASNPDLQEKIVSGNTDVTAGSISQITSAAQDQLRQDQQQAAAEAKEQERILEEIVKEIQQETPAAVITTPSITPSVPASDDSGDSGDSGGSDGSGDSGGSGGSDGGNDGSTPLGPWTVSFYLDESLKTLYGTQTVQNGQAVSCPSLAPSATGNWVISGFDMPYDFTASVRSNLNLVWKYDAET